VAVQLLTYTAQRYIGLAGDQKPTDVTVQAGATFYEGDTANVYTWTGSKWVLSLAALQFSPTGEQTVFARTLEGRLDDWFAALLRELQELRRMACKQAGELFLEAPYRSDK
jgi:hypothetical protein